MNTRFPEQDIDTVCGLNVHLNTVLSKDVKDMTC